MSILPRRTAAASWPLVYALTLIGCTPGPSSGQTPPVPELPDTVAMRGFEGENGLWVHDVGDQIEVAWLTGPGKAGLLELWRGNQRIQRATTPAGRRHAVTLPRPSGSPVVLRYGAADAAGELFRTTLYPEPQRQAPGKRAAVDSLYVVGDVHGERTALLRLLRNAGLVNAEGAWTGGRRHVVFVGDVLDRGDQATGTLWLLYRLEHEAAAAGGSADVVLGNHEIMVFTNDLRYTTPKERMVATLHRTGYQRMFDPRASVLGRWLASRPGLMQVGDVLLAHGGVAPEYARYSVDAFNDSLSAYMAEPLFTGWADSTLVVVTDSALAAQVRATRPELREVVVMDSAGLARRADFFFGERGVFWFRGYAQTDTLGAALGEVLARYGARIHVVGHTPLPTLAVRYGGRFVDTDLIVPARELLLLVRMRDGQGYRGYKYGLEGPPQDLGLLPERPSP